MNLLALKKDLAIQNKNGTSFLLAGVVVWVIITILHLQPFDMYTKNIYSLYATGLMFPLGVLFSVMMKIDWKSKTNPLGSLGLILNVAQFVYFPLFVWAWMEQPADVVIYFAIITSAHFFTYGWLYGTKIYYILSPLMVVFLFTIGRILNEEQLWVIPMTMCLWLLVLIGLLWKNYQKRCL